MPAGEGLTGSWMQTVSAQDETESASEQSASETSDESASEGQTDEGADNATQQPSGDQSTAEPDVQGGTTGDKESGDGIVVPDDVSPEKAERIRRFQRVYGRYSDEVRDYQATIDSLIDAEYQRRVARINQRFDRRLEDLEAIERDRRVAAIDRFKGFLDEYPNHPTYTPDAMFRLAELYFEKAKTDYRRADDRYRKQQEAYRKGRRPSAPTPPRRDYSKTIETFSNLIANWPDYRLLDGAYYLLAYCHQEMGNVRKARDLFAELVVKRPRSEFVPEAWVRIGEYHFDYSNDPEEIRLAQQAYEQAMKYKESKFYDKALYKLAWTHYRLDHFDEAIQRFEQLVEYSDAQRAEGESGSVLRAEAVQYIAVSLAEEDWDLDGSVDDGFVMPRVKKYLGEGKQYEREVLTQLVDFLFENSRFERAADLIRFGLDAYPMHPKNPKLHEKLVVALMRPPRNLDKAFEVRRNLSEKYGEGSDWYEHQEDQGNAQALKYANNLVRENLIQSATWYHEQAQKKKDEARDTRDRDKLAKAREMYTTAAEAYAEFLKKYPNDEDIYRWNFYYADCLYYSEQYFDAYNQYRVVRELDVENNKFQSAAGFNAIKALEFHIKELANKGELSASVVPGGNVEEARETAQQQQQQQGERGEQKQPEGQEGGDQADSTQASADTRKVPDILQQYVTALDRYVVLQLDYKEDEELGPRFAFNAGKIFYDFKKFEPARERFIWVVNNYPDKEVGYLAGSLILETYRQEENYEKLAEWADKLSNVIKGEQAEQVREEVREFKLGAMFKSAEKLFSQEKYDKAAKEYVKLVDKAPDHKNAPRALNNAAVAYERISKYESAMKLYERLYRKYPDDPLAGYGLYRVAINSERFFEFEKAVRTYRMFYEKFEGRSPPELEETMGFDVSEKRKQSLINAAVLTKNLQQYETAAGRFETFVRQYPNAEEAPSAQWEAVEAWRKAERTDKMIDAIEVYRREYGADPEHAERALKGLLRRAKWHKENDRWEDAKADYNQILKEFENRETQKGGPAAQYAAEAQFMLAEHDFQEWKKLKIDGSLADQKEKLQTKISRQKEVAAKFAKVFPYQSLEWVLAAGYRRGSLYQNFANSLYNVPIPFDPGTERYRIYRTKLEDIAIPLEDKAVEQYKQVIAKARDEKLVNKWTKRALQELNKYRPQEYPLYKEERRAQQSRVVTGAPLLTEPLVAKAKEQADGDGGGDDSGQDGIGGGSLEDGGGASEDNSGNDEEADQPGGETGGAQEDGAGQQPSSSEQSGSAESGGESGQNQSSSNQGESTDSDEGASSSDGGE
jgi:TolA-binding protein